MKFFLRFQQAHPKRIFATAPKSLHKVRDGRKRRTSAFLPPLPPNPANTPPPLTIGGNGSPRKERVIIAGHSPRCPPGVAWLHRTRFDWPGVKGGGVSAQGADNICSRGKSERFKTCMVLRLVLLGCFAECRGASNPNKIWRVRQDLNLQPSDPKSEALSN